MLREKDVSAHEAMLGAAAAVVELLARQQLRLVLAESCTGGNVAGALAAIPGVSAWLCGSFVIYRNESKAQWLGIPRDLLNDPAIGPVSAQVTQLLAEQALAATPEAQLGVAVTGHVGPGSPPALDGHVFFALAQRGRHGIISADRVLVAAAPEDVRDVAGREQRLIECSTWVLEQTRRHLPSLTV
jgi:PncC family amidohydrolase